MKKLKTLFIVLALCVPLTVAAQDIEINEKNFPDANFRNYLLSQSYGKDGVLTEAEIKGIAGINVSGKNISSLKGIEYFTVLTELLCNSNQLTALDVSKNTALTSLDCANNQLTALDVSGCTALTELSCSSNQLTALDVSKNTALTSLACYNNVIRGKAMDNLISSLPQNTTNAPHKFYIYNNTESDEGNVCTKSQVTVVKAKGWTPLYYNGTEWLEYEGSDDEPTEPISITLPEMETVDVNSTIQLTPTIEPAGVETELTWSSDDESIAKVTSKGLGAGIKPGTAIISVRTSNNLIAECFVIVQDISGIEDVNAGDGNNKTVYTISGQKVTKPVKGGIYIINGKKVVMK